MANDIQMGEPKADVHPPDMISDAISQPEEAAGLEATPMAVEAAAAAEATAEAMTEETPEAVVEETMEAVPEATPQATREAMPGAAAEATTEATPEATTEDKTQGSTEAQTEALTEAKTEATTEAKTAAVADGAEGSHAPTGGDDAVVDEVSVVFFCGYFVPAHPCAAQASVLPVYPTSVPGCLVPGTTYGTIQSTTAVTAQTYQRAQQQMSIRPIRCALSMIL